MLKNADDVDAAAGSVTEEPLMPAYSSVSSDGRARTGDQGWHVVRTSKSPNLDHVSTCRRHGLQSRHPIGDAEQVELGCVFGLSAGGVRDESEIGAGNGENVAIEGDLAD